MQLVLASDGRQAKVSVILLDWRVRESFHSLHYLNRQTVPRSAYELIWIEFYDHKPVDLLRLVNSPTTGLPMLDKWLVLGYGPDVHYHKHRMYNAGIILAKGEICVICDSDAIFQPTFIESIIETFNNNPGSVVHVDEVRNNSRRFYPFSYPTITDVLSGGCINWTGITTNGLNNSQDFLHEANCGACFAALRKDLIDIGGSDEDKDYLGYICGPYEMTYRLVNFGRKEHWLRNEYLYHLWHPNTSGYNVEYKGPDDGRGMSVPALEARATGRVAPFRENQAITQLRLGLENRTDPLLRLLVKNDGDEWITTCSSSGDSRPYLIERGFHGFDIIYFQGKWYGLGQDQGKFDPEKVKSRQYSRCLERHSLDAIKHAIRHPRTWRRRLKDLVKRFFLLKHDQKKSFANSALKAMNWRLVEQGYHGCNIIYFQGTWYGLGQEEGEFDPDKIKNRSYSRCFHGDSLDAVKRAICRPAWTKLKQVGRNFLVRGAGQVRCLGLTFDDLSGPWLVKAGAVKRLIKRLTWRKLTLFARNFFIRETGKRTCHDFAFFDPSGPRLVKRGYLGFNILYFQGSWYGLGQEEGEFNPEKVKNRSYARCVQGNSPRTVKRAIRRLTWRKRTQFARKFFVRGFAPIRRHDSISLDHSSPRLVKQGYLGFNIIYFQGKWYGLGQEQGSFDESKVGRAMYTRCFQGDSCKGVKLAIRRQRTWKQRLKDIAKTFIQPIRSN